MGHGKASKTLGRGKGKSKPQSDTTSCPGEMLKTKQNKLKTTSAGEDVEKLEPSDIAGGNGKWLGRASRSET